MNEIYVFKKMLISTIFYILLKNYLALLNLLLIMVILQTDFYER